ncbi:MAG: type II toxin-antitoxin system HicB family antitoxin [Bhargavaea sp.]
MKTIDYYLSLPYPLEIVRDPEESGYVARFPDLPGCLTCGETLESVTKNAEDAKRAWLAAALEDDVPVAEPEENGTKSGFPRKAEKIPSASTKESDTQRA